MEQWQLALSVIGAFIAVATLCLAAYKIIDVQVQRVRKDLNERMEASENAQTVVNGQLHQRISEVKDDTPTHRDLMRIEQALTQISQRMDQFFDIFVKSRGGKND